MIGDDELVATIDRFLGQCDNQRGGTADTKVSQRMKTGMKRYLGDPLGNEQKGQSKFVSRDIFEVTESIVPSLEKTFAVHQNPVHFKPIDKSRDAQRQAKEELDAVKYVWFCKNNGFINQISAFKDALIQINGYLRVEVDKRAKTKTISLANLMPHEFNAYLSLPEYKLKGKFTAKINFEEVGKFSPDEFAQADVSIGPNDVVLFDAKFNHTEVNRNILVDCVPPENMRVLNSHKSPMLENALFVAEQMTEVTEADLLALNVSKSKVDRLPTAQGYITPLQQVRRGHGGHYSGQNVWADDSMRPIDVVRSFVIMDYEESGRPELWEVWKSGGDILDGDIEPEAVDFHPYFSCTPNMVPHRHDGLSIADQIDHLVQMKSAMFRGVADNVYHSVHPRPIVNVAGDFNEYTMSDLRTDQAGLPIRVHGLPAERLGWRNNPPFPQHAFAGIEYLDGTREDITGVGDNTSLDPQQLSQTNTGVFLKSMDLRNEKSDLIAKMFANTLIAPAYLRVQTLIRRVGNIIAYDAGGFMASADPRSWPDRHEMSIMVGQKNKNREALGVEALLNVYEKLAAFNMYGDMFDDVNLYNAVDKLVEAYELGDTENFFIDQMNRDQMDPERAQMMQQKLSQAQRPSDTQILAQMTREVEQMKAETNAKVKLMEAQLKQQQFAVDKRIEAREQERKEFETGADIATERAKLELEYDKNVPGSAV